MSDLYTMPLAGQQSGAGAGSGEVDGDGAPKPTASLPPPPLFMKRGQAAAGALAAGMAPGDERHDMNHPRAPRAPLPSDGRGAVDRVAVSDDPLSVEASSKWAQYWLDAELVEEIHKDGE